MKKFKRVANVNGKHIYEKIQPRSQEEVEEILSIKPQVHVKRITPVYGKTLAEITALKEMPYPDYLLTPHWQKIKSIALRHAEYRCMVCNSALPLHVHHRTYERRGEERPSDVIALCEQCHGKFHDKLPTPNLYHAPIQKNGGIKKLDRDENSLPETAAFLKRAFDEFMKVGFKEHQAFKLVINHKNL